MAKFTIPQVENNIDNSITMEHLDVFKDYMETMFNLNMETIKENILILKSAIEGTDAILGHLGVPHGPAAVAPANPNKFDWYFNTTDQIFYMYVDGVWKEIASLSNSIDLSGYYTIEAANDRFLPGVNGTLTELKKVENGEKVLDQNTKYINLTDLADILNDQKKIDKAFLANFDDDLIYKSATEIDYVDSVLQKSTLKAAVVTTGASVIYSTLISPYDRISQFQANFEATLNQDMTVEYQFIGKGKALRFTGSAGQTYKWDHIQKYEGDTTVDYIRFTGTTALSINSSFSIGTPGNYFLKAMPYEMKLSDLMDDKQGKAIVEMTFSSAVPTPGQKLMNIKYLTSTLYVENRFKLLLNDVNKRIDGIDITVAKNYLTNFNKNLHLMQLDNAEDDIDYVIEVRTTAPNDSTLNLGRFRGFVHAKIGKTVNISKTILFPQTLVNAGYGTGDGPDGAIYYSSYNITLQFIESATQPGKIGAIRVTDIQWFDPYAGSVATVKDAANDVQLRWATGNSRVKAWMMDNLHIESVSKAGEFRLDDPSVLDTGLIKLDVGTGHEDEVLGFTSGGKTEFKKIFTEAKANAKFATKEYDFLFGGANLVTAEDTTGGVRKLDITAPNGNYKAFVFDVANVEIGQEIYFNVALANGVTPQDADQFRFNGERVFDKDGSQITWLNWKDIYDTHSFKLRRVKVGAELYWQWVDYKVRPIENAKTLFEPRLYDYSSDDLTVTRQVQGTKAFLIITQPADAPNTPIGAINKIKFKTPAGAQDADQVTYGSDLIWIYKNATDIMTWDEIKDHVADEEKMVIQHLDNGHWQLVKWEAKGVSPQIQKDIDNRLTLNLDNVKSDVEKQAFINGLKAIGIEVSLFKEFKGVLAAEPTTANDLDWYILSTDDSIHVYHNSAWHQIGAAAGGTAALDKTAILTMLGITDADLTKLKGIQTDLDGKQDTLTKTAALNLLGITEVQMDQLKTLQTNLDGKQPTLDIAGALGILGLTQAQLDAVKTLTADLAAKEDTLTKTVTLTFDDNTTEDVKVG